MQIFVKEILHIIYLNIFYPFFHPKILEDQKNRVPLQRQIILIYFYCIMTTNKTILTIKNPSKRVVDFLNKLRDRKIEHQKSVKNEHKCTFEIQA